jgi:ketosteroid isomerase-like protein
MRSFLAVTPMVVLAACAASPQVDLAAEKAAVEARSAGLAQAEAAKDVDAAINFWADDAIVQTAGAPATVGVDAVRKGYTEMFGALESFKSTPTAVNVAASGDVAWEHGVNDLVFSTPNGNVPDRGKYLVIWKKMNGEWYVAALSFTTDTPVTN